MAQRGRPPGIPGGGASRRDPTTGLTRHQQIYVDGVTAGKTFLDAYQEAYNCKNLKHDEVRRRAFELSRAPEVALELARIRELARDKSAYSVADAVAEAELVRQMAMEDRAAAAATGAIHLKVKLLGLITDKVEQTTKQIPATLPELEGQLRDVMRQLGIEAPDDLADVARDNIVPLSKRA